MTEFLMKLKTTPKNSKIATWLMNYFVSTKRKNQASKGGKNVKQ